MNSIIMSINTIVLVLAVGGCLVLVIAAWKAMKALESISTTLNKIYERQE